MPRFRQQPDGRPRSVRADVRPPASPRVAGLIHSTLASAPRRTERNPTTGCDGQGADDRSHIARGVESRGHTGQRRPAGAGQDLGPDSTQSPTETERDELLARGCTVIPQLDMGHVRGHRVNGLPDERRRARSASPMCEPKLHLALLRRDPCSIPKMVFSSRLRKPRQGPKVSGAS